MAVVAVAMGLAASCRTGMALRAQRLPEPPDLEKLVATPRIRIGLQVDVSKASLAADSGVIIYDFGKDSAWSGRRATVQRATFVSTSGELGPRFRVQVANLVDGGAARDLAARTEAASGLPPLLRFNPQTGAYQLRVGEFRSRTDAENLARSLSAQGLGTPFIIEEAGPQPGARLRLLETGEEFVAVTVVPANAAEHLSVDGAPFRGVFEVRGGEGDTITAVNIVNLDDYLKGVVPSELSPLAYPEIEAQKAQAVAARTYALRHHDQFAAKGYDLCATTSCQVYRGEASEDPLSTRAVEETRGIAAYYRGILINAYYTSTCGGHTEDGDNMFEGYPQPYLRGVACVPERSAFTTIRAPRVPFEERDQSLLQALGVLDSDVKATGSASEGELRNWTKRLLASLHRSGCEAEVGRTRGQFFRFLVSSLCWDERATRLLAPGDPDYLLQVEDKDELTPPERIAAALLLSEGVVQPFPDNTLRLRDPVLRADAMRILARVAQRAGGPSLITGEFLGTKDGELLVKRGSTTDLAPVRAGIRLFRVVDGTTAAASEVTLPVGEKVDVVLRDGKVAFLEAQQNLLGAALDRTGHYYRWEVRLTPGDVERGISRYGRVGRVKDLKVERRGSSGRVVELRIEGSESDMVLRGLKIRNALGLRENFFVVDRERDGAGSVERFVVTGKGWGHGVGLCQVGSYGMALAGSSYEDILRHYYTGISLDQAYSSPSR